MCLFNPAEPQFAVPFDLPVQWTQSYRVPSWSLLPEWRHDAHLQCLNHVPSLRSLRKIAFNSVHTFNSVHDQCTFRQLRLLCRQLLWRVLCLLTFTCRDCKMLCNIKCAARSARLCYLDLSRGGCDKFFATN